MSVCAVVPAGGTGTRMGGTVPKQFLELDGKPILYYTLKTLQDCGIISELILVVPEKEYENAKNGSKGNKTLVSADGKINTPAFAQESKAYKGKTSYK